MVEKFGVPSIMLADIEDTDYISGSGRAGQFLHLREALQDVEDRTQGLLISFGGHKAAAGLKFHKGKLKEFKKEFYKSVEDQLKGQDTTPYISTDGSLANSLTLETHYEISNLAPFGMGFPTPSFSDIMEVTNAIMVGKNPVHLSMHLDGIKAIQFFSIDKPGDPMPVQNGDRVKVVYQIAENVWNGYRNLQILVKKTD
jgi:single-stranded-DNA-specific exonuclease